MNENHFTRRNSIYLTLSSLLGLTACSHAKNEAASKDAGSDDAKKMQEMKEAMLLEIAEITKPSAAASPGAAAVTSAVARERESVMGYYKDVLAKKDAEMEQMRKQLRELANKATPTDKDKQAALDAADKPGEVPPPPPSQVLSDDDEEEEKQKAAIGALMALLCIFFPELAPLAGLLGGAASGLSSGESEEFSENVRTGKAMSPTLQKKVEKNSTLRKIQKAGESARKSGVTMEEPDADARKKAAEISESGTTPPAAGGTTPPVK